MGPLEPVRAEEKQSAPRRRRGRWEGRRPAQVLFRAKRMSAPDSPAHRSRRQHAPSSSLPSQLHLPCTDRDLRMSRQCEHCDVGRPFSGARCSSQRAGARCGESNCERTLDLDERAGGVGALHRGTERGDELTAVAEESLRRQVGRTLVDRCPLMQAWQAYYTQQETREVSCLAGVHSEGKGRTLIPSISTIFLRDSESYDS